MHMSQQIKEEILPPRLRHRYKERGRRGPVLLNEFCEQWPCDRKYAIKLLNGNDDIDKSVCRRRGRPSIYGSEVIQVLESIWEAAQQPCGKRMNQLCLIGYLIIRRKIK